MKTRALLFVLLALILIQSTAGSGVLACDSGCYDVLVVGPERYRTSMERFIDFKRGQGTNVRYFSIEAICENQSELDRERSLHDFVASERKGKGIRYLLLVGTYDQVPTKYVYSPSYECGLADYNFKPSDWYYGVPDWNDSEVGILGGNLPEVAVGRLPVRDEEELERTISKVIEEETNFEPGPLLVLGDADVVQDSALATPHLYYSSSVNLTSQVLVRLLSSGTANVISYSHGTVSALWTSDSNGRWRILMSCEQVPEITATYGIQYMIACFTGALDLGNESLARALITSAKGPALVVASTRVEMSGDLISSRFWDEFLKSSDVGGSMVRALRSYLLDQSIFSPGEYSFQYYSSYLDKAVYGDISWVVRSNRSDQSASPNLLTHTVQQDTAPDQTRIIGEDSAGSEEFSAWLPLAVALASCAILAGLRRVLHDGGARANSFLTHQPVRLSKSLRGKVAPQAQMSYSLSTDSRLLAHISRGQQAQADA